MQLQMQLAYARLSIRICSTCTNSKVREGTVYTGSFILRTLDNKTDVGCNPLP
jgi:hypothetical protein